MAVKRKTRSAIAAMARFASWPFSGVLLGECGDRPDHRLVPIHIVSLVDENAGDSRKTSDHQADNC